MSPGTRHTAELALIFAVPMICEPRGRLKSLMGRLQKIAGKELAKLPKLTAPELQQITEKIHAWGRITGWLDNEKHAGTLLSFCLAMIENSKFSYPASLIETINQICEFFDRAGKFKESFCWAGSLAAERWEGIFE